jgi:rubrerythrin
VDTDSTRPDEIPAPAAAAEILEGLNDLLRLDHDAIGAYEIAMEKLEDRDHAGQIAGFLRDHERHIRELNELIAELGGTATNEPHATGPFKQALQSLGGLAGDRGLLVAFRANELLARAKYDAYASRANAWPTAVKRVVDRSALDEERHYRWVSEALAAMGVGSGEGAEIDAVDALRERAAVTAARVEKARERAAEAVEDVRERAGEVAGQVRARASEAADAVRNRIASLVESDADATVPGGAAPLPPREGWGRRWRTVSSSARSRASSSPGSSGSSSAGCFANQGDPWLS